MLPVLSYLLMVVRSLQCPVCESFDCNGCIVYWKYLDINSWLFFQFSFDGLCDIIDLHCLLTLEIHCSR